MMNHNHFQIINLQLPVLRGNTFEEDYQLNFVDYLFYFHFISSLHIKVMTSRILIKQYSNKWKRP